MAVKTKDWEFLTPEEQRTISWFITRYLEEHMPREITTIAMLMMVKLAVSELPALKENGEVPEMEPEMSWKASAVCVNLCNIFRQLFIELHQKSKIDVIAELNEIAENNGLNWETSDIFTSVSNNIAQKYIGQGNEH